MAIYLSKQNEINMYSFHIQYSLYDLIYYQINYCVKDIYCVCVCGLVIK